MHEEFTSRQDWPIKIFCQQIHLQQKYLDGIMNTWSTSVLPIDGPWRHHAAILKGKTLMKQYKRTATTRGGAQDGPMANLIWLLPEGALLKYVHKALLYTSSRY